jgi:CheY-like chemotaxis protein
VRALAARVLAECGYTVLQAGNGHDAIAIVEDLGNGRGGIDLLVTDAVLPWYSGRELSRRVRALSPRTKVLFISGYTASATTRHGVLEPGVVLLPKPFTPAALAQKVREVLDAP